MSTPSPAPSAPAAPDPARRRALAAALAAVALPARDRDVTAEIAGLVRGAPGSGPRGDPDPVVALDSEAAARRLVSLCARLGAPGARVEADPAGDRWRVRPGADGHADLARRVGLVDLRGRPRPGLAPWQLAGSVPEAVATWRGALLAAARLVPGTDPGALELTVPVDPGFGRGLCELGLRLGVRGRVVRGAGAAVVVDAPGEAALLLASCGGGAAVTAAGLAPDSDRSANETRAAVAAVRATSTVADAFAVLEAAGVAVPEPLAAAGRLRLRHPTLGLAELAAEAAEPLGKDALAGRLRRLSALAARHRPGRGSPRS